MKDKNKPLGILEALKAREQHLLDEANSEEERAALKERIEFYRKRYGYYYAISQLESESLITLKEPPKKESAKPLKKKESEQLGILGSIVVIIIVTPILVSLGLGMLPILIFLFALTTWASSEKKK